MKFVYILRRNNDHSYVGCTGTLNLEAENLAKENGFGVIYYITGGGPNAGSYSRGFAGDTDILISWMYKLTVDESIYNIASVFSVLIFIFVGSITAWNLSRTRAFKED